MNETIVDHVSADNKVLSVGIICLTTSTRMDGFSAISALSPAGSKVGAAAIGRAKVILAPLVVD